MDRVRSLADPYSYLGIRHYYIQLTNDRLFMNDGSTYMYHFRPEPLEASFFTARPGPDDKFRTRRIKLTRKKTPSEIRRILLLRVVTVQRAARPRVARPRVARPRAAHPKILHLRVVRPREVRRKAVPQRPARPSAIQARLVISGCLIMTTMALRRPQPLPAT